MMTVVTFKGFIVKSGGLLADMYGGGRSAMGSQEDNDDGDDDDNNDGDDGDGSVVVRKYIGIFSVVRFGG